MKSRQSLPLPQRLSVAALLGTLFVAPQAFAQFGEEPAEPELTEEAPAPEAEEAPSPEPETAEEAPEPAAPLELEAAEDDDSPDDVLDADMSLKEEAPGEFDEPARSNKSQPQANTASGNGMRPLWDGLVGDNNYFGFDGGMEMDVGYADFRFSEETFPPETFHDFRGQFWLTPTLEHRFGSNKDLFVRARAELVAWIRDEPSEDKFRVFDVFAQVGMDDVANLAVGRVTTTRIYQPGNGFDIFTLEHRGCLTEPNYSGGNFCAPAYEIDKLWLRNRGRGVLSIYPLKKLLPKEWNELEIQGAGEYGKGTTSNTLGARGSIVYDNQWFRLAAGVEYEESKKAAKEWEDGEVGVVCKKCLWNYSNGYGGSVVVRPPYVMAGYNYADAHGDGYTLTGVKEANNSSDNLTQGGFVELHTGDLLAVGKGKPWYADQRNADGPVPSGLSDPRRITVGYGGQRTEFVQGNGNFEVHNKQAVYIKYNLGFNRSFLKFVLSKSDSDQYNLVSAEGADVAEYDLSESDMLAGRLRFAYYW